MGVYLDDKTDGNCKAKADHQVQQHGLVLLEVFSRPEDVEQLALQRRLAFGEHLPRLWLLADGLLIERVSAVALGVVLQLEIADEARDRINDPLRVEHHQVAQAR